MPSSAAVAVAAGDKINTVPNGLTIPGISVQDQLGEGSFGAVYRARHLIFDLDVAVKLIQPSSFEDPAELDNVLAEARLMARLDHPNLLRIYDAGRVGGSIYLTMELMDESCQELRALPADQAVSFANQLLGGLQALHEARIIHRDIKPANCLRRSRDNRVKLADLGIAVRETTRTSQRRYDFAGTLPFMAPETFDDPPRFGPLSDLYALGITMACMVLDSDPYPARTQSELMGWILGRARPRVGELRTDLPAALTSLVERMIAPDPSRRPQSAAEALVTLGAASTSAPSPAVRVPSESPSLTSRVIGPWLLGETVYTSPSWNHYVVTHVRTGAPGRLAELNARSIIADARKTILTSAARASELKHRAIVDVFDWGQIEGTTFVVSAPQGQTLQRLVEAQGPVDELEGVEFTLSLAEAIAYLHGAGLVYETVDPGSAVIAPNAREAQLGWPIYCVPMGTPATDSSDNPVRVWVPKWSPPEVVFEPHKGTIDATVDIYGLGEILFFLLAGKQAFDGSQGHAALGYAKLQRVPHLRDHAPDVTAPTASLVRRLLDPEPANRPATAGEVVEMLRRIRDRLAGAAVS
jgi:serine/threonine protein kinase